MPNAFNQILAGLSGGFTGYASEQDRQVKEARQATQDRYLNEDRASQRALRDAQAQSAAEKARQDAALRTPAFQELYRRARSGDEDAVAQVASAVVGHPDAATFMAPLVKQPKTQLMQTDQGVARIPLEGAPGLVTAPGGAVYGKPAPVAPPISPYQQQMLDLYGKRLKVSQDAAAKKAAQPTPDQVKSQTVQALADPAAIALSSYYAQGGPKGAAPYLSGTLSHVPFVGNRLQNVSDNGANFQTAMSNARVLGTQYLEIMPKSRFQPSTIDDIMKQIAPEPGDNPQKQAQKAARVKQLQSAIRKRATLRPDAPADDLTDIPEPPGTEPQ